MSTSQAEEYDEIKEWVKCQICDGSFVEGGLRIYKPLGVCIWCYSRKPLYRRYMALYEALQLAVQDHPPDCSEKCCRIARMSHQIMNPDATLSASGNLQPHSGQEEVKSNA